MVAHLVAMFVAGIILPHLRAERFLFGWPLLLVLTSTVYLFAKGSLPSKVPGWAWVAGGTIVLAVIARPIAGGGIGALSDTEYWFYRFRFLSGKPDPCTRQSTPDHARGVLSAVCVSRTSGDRGAS